jgi:hypothetical protein
MAIPAFGLEHRVSYTADPQTLDEAKYCRQFVNILNTRPYRHESAMR